MVAFFDADDWTYQPMDNAPVLSMGFTGKSGKWMCFAQAREEQQQFVFYSLCPINIPPESLHSAAEFLTRANYGMIIGNFEMDYSDGEVRYKTSIDIEGDELTPALIKQMVYANVIIMDRYLPGIMRVSFGESSPEIVVSEIEDGLPPESRKKDDDDEPDFKFSLDDIDFSRLDITDEDDDEPKDDD